MRAAELRLLLEKIQQALRVIAALQLTAYMYPPHAAVKDGDTFDFIVVGAGTAGCAVANRISRNPAVNVLLIEAGEDAPIESNLPGPIHILKRSYYDWSYNGEPDKYFGQCHVNPYSEMSLGKMLGGTSSLNYMIYERATPRQFNSWADSVNDSTWRWENVVSYYENSAKLVNPRQLKSDNESVDYLRYIKEVGDLHNLFEAYAELGYNVENQDDNKVNTYYKFGETIADGQRQSSATAFLTPILNRNNLKVLKNTVVNKILFDANKNAIGVETTNLDGKQLMFKARKEVIISAGAMNSPKLLMLSGIGPEEHLKSLNIEVLSDLPVGSNLQDPISTTVIHSMEKLEAAFKPINPHAYPPMGFGGVVALNASQNYSDYQTLSYKAPRELHQRFLTFVLRYNDEVCDGIYTGCSGRHPVLNQVIKLNPKSKGKVMLRSANPADPPLIYPGYLNNVEDLEDLARYLVNFAKVMNTTYFRSVDAKIVIPNGVKCGEMVVDSIDYWKCYVSCMISGISSFTGTCSMGPVVDGRLRVHGVQRLRVVDSSVIPSPLNNPYGTLVMFGEKVADFVTEEYNL